MGLPKAFLRLPTPTSLLKPAGVPRRLASAATHIHLSHPPSTSLSALRLLARRLFSTVPPVARLPTPPAPRDLASKVRLHASPSFHPAAQQAKRFGPGGLGRGPMGPGVKSGFAGGRSVANVGLGQARGYASAARPLLDNFVSNAPLILRAGLNELEDQVSDLKKQKKGSRSSALAKGKKRSSTSSRAQSIFQSTTLPIRGLTNTKAAIAGVSRPSAEQENEEEEDFNTFFHPSVHHSLPAARSPWSTTTLTIPLSPGLFDGLPSSSISHLVTHHRAYFDQHRARLDALLYSLERKGVWLDRHVRVECEEDEVRIVFESRSREEVKEIVGQRSGEGTWWVLSERRKGSSDVKFSTTTRLEGSLVFPLLSASVIVPSFGASPLSVTSEKEEFDGRSSVVSNSTFLSDDDDNASSLGFSSAFLSDLSVSSAGQQGFTLVELEGMEGFDEVWGDA